MLGKKVKDLKIEGKGFYGLIKKMDKAGGFSGKNLAQAVFILEKMIKEKKCKKILSFPACITATGLRGTIAQMISRRLVDVIITTGGTVDHDLARAWGGEYFQGSFDLDDALLHKKNINRLGNILIPNKSYGIILEKNMPPILKELCDKKNEWGGRELIYEFGKKLKDEKSILFQAARKNIPVYCPGLLDGAFGTNLFIFYQDHAFRLDLLKDEKELAEMLFRKQKTGALIIGGGISKHHTIWWNQFKGGLDYAVNITTATQYDGSLTGARLKEAVSWGKISEKAKYVTVDGDATIILPIILSALYEKI